MIPGRMPADAHEWTILIIGFVVSFIVALAVVAWFMNWVRQRGFTPFGICRHRGAGVGDERVKVSILAITRFR